VDVRHGCKIASERPQLTPQQRGRAECPPRSARAPTIAFYGVHKSRSGGTDRSARREYARAGRECGLDTWGPETGRQWGGGDNSARKPETPVIIAASAGERTRTSRDDNSSEGHPGTPAALRELGSLSDTPLKARTIQGHTRQASAPFAFARRRRPRFRTHRRAPSAHPVLPPFPRRRPFVASCSSSSGSSSGSGSGGGGGDGSFIAGTTGSLSLHDLGPGSDRKESRTRFHVDAHRKQLNSTPGRLYLFEDAGVRGSDYGNVHRVTVSTRSRASSRRASIRSARNGKFWRVRSLASGSVLNEEPSLIASRHARETPWRIVKRPADSGEPERRRVVKKRQTEPSAGTCYEFNNISACLMS